MFSTLDKEAQEKILEAIDYKAGNVDLTDKERSEWLALEISLRHMWSGEGEERPWHFNVHDDGLYAGIWREGDSGETLLRIGGQPGPPGVRDHQRVREFADALAQPDYGTGEKPENKIDAPEPPDSRCPVCRKFGVACPDHRAGEKPPCETCGGKEAVNECPLHGDRTNKQVGIFCNAPMGTRLTCGQALLRKSCPDCGEKPDDGYDPGVDGHWSGSQGGTGEKPELIAAIEAASKKVPPVFDKGGGPIDRYEVADACIRAALPHLCAEKPVESGEGETAKAIEAMEVGNTRGKEIADGLMFSCSGPGALSLEEEYIADERAALERERRQLGLREPNSLLAKERIVEIDQTLARLDESAEECDVPPPGWRCTRAKGHDGPCAAVPSQPVETQGAEEDGET